MQVTRAHESTVQRACLTVSVVERASLADQSCMCMLQANTSGYQVIFYGAGLCSYYTCCLVPLVTDGDHL